MSELRTIDAAGEQVSITGILRDAFNDEIDPDFTYAVINCDGEDVYTSFSAEEDPASDIESILGERVSLVGYARNLNFLTIGERQIKSRISTHFASIKPVSAITLDPIRLPEIPDLFHVPFPHVHSLGKRKATGFVIARWDEKNALLKTDTGKLVSVSFAARCVPPTYGAYGIAFGIPETDTYQINLRHAGWQSGTNASTLVRCTPKAVGIRDIVMDEHGRRRFNARLYGQTLSLRGKVLAPNAGNDAARQFLLEHDGEIAKVDCSSTPGILTGIPTGSEIALTGTCILEIVRGTSLPRINGFFIVPHDKGDITLLSRPSWWTPRKFAVLSFGLLTLLALALVWSFMLRRLADRRGEELAKEKLCAVESELKVYERTRLAIELHDFLSQMLSGISMQIDTVRKFFDSNREKTLHHLDIASKTLLACRENLRDCLWDLRNRALEEPDMNAAIRKTLEPHAEDAALLIRFNVPRERLSDNAAHVVLSIVRELTVNALRHGKATSVKIAGCLENGKALFSVSDNGCGFDPDAAPGMGQGHFGLQGIRERVEGFEGEMSVSSAIGEGTKVAITLNLPQDDNGGTEKWLGSES